MSNLTDFIGGAGGAAPVGALQLFPAEMPTNFEDGNNEWLRTGYYKTDVGNYDPSTYTTGLEVISDSNISQNSDPYRVEFSQDGTMLFIYGTRSASYNLSTPYDLSTASYSNDISGGGLDDRKISADGKHLYYLTTSVDKISHYLVDTPYDLSTASLNPDAFLSTAQETWPTAFTISPDGTKLYVGGADTDSIHQYTLSTPFVLASASYDSISFSVAAQNSGVGSFNFSDGGTKLYMLGTGGSPRNVYQYSLSTPYDISTASYDSVSLEVGTSTATSAYVSEDGLYLLVTRNSTYDSVEQYTLSTLYDISTATLSNTLYTSFGGENFSMFNNTGSKLYRYYLDDVYEITLNTNYDVSLGSILNVQSINLSPATTIAAAEFKDDGTKLYVVCSGTDTVYQYSLSTPYDVITASYDSVSKSINVADTNPNIIRFSPDGSQLYIGGLGNDKVDSYAMLIPWDLSSSSTNPRYSVVTASILSDMVISPDGLYVYVLDGRTLVRYPLSEPYNPRSYLNDATRLDLKYSGGDIVILNDNTIMQLNSSYATTYDLSDVVGSPAVSSGIANTFYYMRIK